MFCVFFTLSYPVSILDSTLLKGLTIETALGTAEVNICYFTADQDSAYLAAPHLCPFVVVSNEGGAVYGNCLSLCVWCGGE